MLKEILVKPPDLYVCLHLQAFYQTNKLATFYLSFTDSFCFPSHFSFSQGKHTKKNNAKKCSRFSRNKFAGAFKTKNNVAGEVWDVGSGED